ARNTSNRRSSAWPTDTSCGSKPPSDETSSVYGQSGARTLQVLTPGAHPLVVRAIGTPTGQTQRVSSAVIPINVTLVLVLVILVAVAAVVTAAGGLGPAHSPLLAAVRAAVQLAVVSGIITFLLETGWWAVFVVVMVAAAVV